MKFIYGYDVPRSSVAPDPHQTTVLTKWSSESSQHPLAMAYREFTPVCLLCRGHFSPWFGHLRCKSGVLSMAGAGGCPWDKRLGATEVNDGACTHVAPLFLCLTELGVHIFQLHYGQ